MPAVATQTSAAATFRRSVRVLTVDDQRPFRQAARALVSQTPGFDLVAEAGDGPEALLAARQADPDMVLLDVRIPGIDGIETARRMSAEDASRVIVLASSADIPSLPGLAEDCGAAALVRKHWLTPHLLRGLWVAHRRR
jgi:DNA-binding NarL/FixJ family response regulator